MKRLRDIRFDSWLVLANGLVPLSLIAWDAWRGALGANPLEFFTRATGTLTLVFLLLTLAVTPLRKLFGFNWLARHRRAIGLYAFFYGALHFVAYVWFDKNFSAGDIFADVSRRLFIAVGMLAFFLMIPLTVTSTNAMIRRLGGRRWNQLHKLTYAVAIGGVLHYYLLVKADAAKPLVYAALFGALLGYRYFAARFKQSPRAPLLSPRSSPDK